MKHWKKSMMTAAWAVAMGYASPVLADCESDADCGAGMVCVIEEYTMPCAIMDCDDNDEDCAAKAEEMKAACDEAETEVRSYCDRAECEIDADCGEEMICIEYRDEWCSGSSDVACADEDEDCIVEETPVDVECGFDIHKECGYKYEAPCEEDADCGEGFTCEQMEVCSCSSSEGTDVATDSDVDEDGTSENNADVDTRPDTGNGVSEDVEDVPINVGEPECSCEPYGDKMCRLNEIECESDTDCPTGMICDENVDVSEMCTATPDGEPECEAVESPRRCRPDEWYRDTIGIGEDAGSNEAAPTSSNSGDGEKNVDEENPVDESDVEKVDDDNEGDGEVKADNVDEETTDNEKTDDDKDGAKADADEADADSASGGCSVVAPAAGGSTAGGLLALLGLAALAWRRRQ